MAKKKSNTQNNQPKEEEGWTTVEKKSTYVKKELDPSEVFQKPQPKQLISDNKNKLTGNNEKKYNSGGNKQRKTPTGNQQVKDWDEDSSPYSSSSSKSIGVKISQARTTKGLTQEQLAFAINEKVQVLQHYESGKSVVSPQVLAKIEKTLGKKLK
jgi:ribosome-binding protein aMBF1 (putative translation factor)